MPDAVVPLCCGLPLPFITPLLWPLDFPLPFPLPIEDEVLPLPLILPFGFLPFMMGVYVVWYGPAIPSQRLVLVNTTTLVGWVGRFSAVWLFPFPLWTIDWQSWALSLAQRARF